MRKRDDGFTLIEMLISILILALVTGMLLDGLRLVTHSVGRETSRLDRSSQIALVQNFVRAQLGDAQRIVLAAGLAARVDFTGEVDRLVFISPAPASVAFGGLQRLGLVYKAGTSAAGGTIEADWQPYRDGSGAASAVGNRVLLDHVNTAVFAYFGSTRADEPLEWHDEWREMSDLPLLVRLGVVFSDGRTMPELIVALPLAAVPAPRLSGN
jgi:prepilin-type N-terminal cleavage/methylation domain-containing protein